MFGKLAKGIGYFVLFLFCIAFIGAIFGKDDNSTEKGKTVSVNQLDPDPKTLNQKPVFSPNKYFYKGKIYEKDSDNWTGTKFYTQRDNLYYGDNYSTLAKYIGSTNDGYDVYKSGSITFNDYDRNKIKSHNIIYVDSFGNVKWKMVDEIKNTVKEWSGSLNHDSDELTLPPIQ